MIADCKMADTEQPIETTERESDTTNKQENSTTLTVTTTEETTEEQTTTEETTGGETTEEQTTEGITEGTTDPASSSSQQQHPAVTVSNPAPVEAGATASASASMSAVVIGATGAVGRSLVAQLLANKTLCNKVTVFGRRDINEVLPDGQPNNDHEGRLVQHIEPDISALSDDDIKTKCEGANVFFCCLGSTRRAAGSAEAFYRIDHDLVVQFARQAKAANIAHFSLVSSWGANHNSMFLYTRTKGEVEQSVLGLGFPYTTILRPGLLGRGTEARLVEKIVGLVSRAIPVGTVAQAMMNDAHQYIITNNSSNNSVTLNNAEIYRIAATTITTTDTNTNTTTTDTTTADTNTTETN